MTRKKGTFNMQANVEPRLAAPFDARQVVPAKADLTDATNFPFAYVGMIVAVQEEGKVYVLKDNDPTALASWKEIGEGGGGSYVLPPATANTLGGVKVGSGLSVESDGTLSATGSGTGDANFELDEQNNYANVNNNVQYLSMDFNDQDTLSVAAYNPGTYMASRTLATKDYVDAHAGTEYTAGDGINITNNEISADFATDTEIANIVTLVFGS